MRRQPVESEFKVEIFKTEIAVHFSPTRSLYIFTRFITERDISDFGPVSPDPRVQHASRIGGRRIYSGAEVLAMAFRLATAAARAESQ
jgi:hypothetical protein